MWSDLSLPVLETKQPLPGPVEAYFEVSNRCNSLCETCPLTFGPQESAHNLGLEEFKSLVAQLSGLKRAVMHGIGEPLLNRDLPGMIRHLKSRGVYVLFNTNASLLSRGRQVDLIESGLDELRVSIDGSTPETYLKIRGVPLFERAVENTAGMIQARNELGASTPRVSFWVTGMRENLPELPGVIQIAARIGVDEVYLQRMVFSNIGLAVEEQSIYRGHREEAERIIGQAEALAQKLNVTFRGAGAVSPRESIVERTDTPHPWQGCSRPLRLAYVTANGNALPCCIAPFTGVEYDSIVLGNYIRDGVEKVWHGERYDDFRRRLYSPDPHPACANCGLGWSL